MKRLVYIHGANSTSQSFSFLQDKMPEHEILNINYDVNTPFIDNEKRMAKEIRAAFGYKPISFIGHSLGGLFCVRLMNKNKHAERTFSMAAPYGGSRFVGYLTWICPSYQLFKDIAVTSDIIKYFKTEEQTKPILQLITTGGGNPLMGEDNDGTVTVRSQKTILGATFKRVPYNHFEVLLNINTVEHMIKFLL